MQLLQEPVPIRALHGHHVVQIACSKANSGALCSSGELLTWGATCYGLAVCPHTTHSPNLCNRSAQEEPSLLIPPSPNVPQITSFSMGKLHALALSVRDRICLLAGMQVTDVLVLLEKSTGGRQCILVGLGRCVFLSAIHAFSGLVGNGSHVCVRAYVALTCGHVRT